MKLPMKIVLLKRATRKTAMLYIWVHTPRIASHVRSFRPIVWNSGSSPYARALKAAVPRKNAERLTLRTRARKRTKRLWTPKNGVSPATIEKAKARLICEGSVSEFNIEMSLATEFIIHALF